MIKLREGDEARVGLLNPERERGFRSADGEVGGDDLWSEGYARLEEEEIVTECRSSVSKRKQ